MEIDFNYKPTIVKIPLSILCKNLGQKKRRMFSISYEKRQLKEEVRELPKQGEEIEVLSFGAKGISPLSFLAWICETEKVEVFYLSTFRLGYQHFEYLIKLKKEEKLRGECCLCLSTAQQELDGNSKKYNYGEKILKRAKENKINIVFKKNHSKILLMGTEKNFYVLRTSANFDNCTKLEQYTFQNDKGLFNFYKEFFLELIK